MKMIFKQRLFSWFDSYDIYNEEGEAIYEVKGQLAWGHCLQIYDKAGNHLGTVKERVLTFMPTFDLYEKEQYIGQVKKEFTFFIPKFHLDCGDWEVSGDILEWDYQVNDSAGAVVANIQKRILNLTDTYELEVLRFEDAFHVLMVALAIDAAKCAGK